MNFIKKIILEITDFFSDYLGYIIGILFFVSLFLSWLPETSNFSSSIVHRTIMSVPSFAFSLLGFSITSLSILTSLKTTSFFKDFQKINSRIWDRIVDSLGSSAIIYCFFGMFSFIAQVNDFNSTSLTQNIILKTIYLFFLSGSLLITLNVIYLTIMIAKAPLHVYSEERKSDQVSNIFDKPKD